MQKLSLRNVAALAVVLLAVLSTTTSAINFVLAPNTMRCFTEEVPGDTSFKITYLFKGGYTQLLDVTLTDPNGVELFADVGQSQASHAQYSQQGGDFSLCFVSRTAGRANVAKDDKKSTVAFSFKVGTEGIDYKNLATKEKLKPMEVQLRVMEDTVRSIHSEYVYYKAREAEMRSTNEHMTAKVVWMAILVIVIFVVFSYLQLRHLKSYFRKKRMID